MIFHTKMSTLGKMTFENSDPDDKFDYTVVLQRNRTHQDSI